jgi:acyl-CoA thioesterase-1
MLSISSGKRIAAALAIAAAIAVSLMTFPCAIPWMIAFWLGWHVWRVRRGGPGYLLLMTGLGILAIKGVAWIPELIVLAGLMGVVAGVAVCSSKTTPARKRRIAWGGVPGG